MKRLLARPGLLPLRSTQTTATDTESAKRIEAKKRRFVEAALQGDTTDDQEATFASCVNDLQLATLKQSAGHLSLATEALAHCPTVRTLQLGDDVHFYNMRSFVEALAKNTTLHKLHIDNCCFEFDLGAPLEQLAKGIAGSHLKTLVLAYADDSPDPASGTTSCLGLAALGKSLSAHESLECLHITFQHMSALQVESLAAGLAHNRRLTRLTLQSDTAGVMLPMVLALGRGALPQLEHLALIACDEGSMVSARELAALSRVLANHKCLLSLQLAPQYLVPEAIDTITDGLVMSRNITSLEPHPLVTPWTIPPTISAILQRNSERGVRC